MNGQPVESTVWIPVAPDEAFALVTDPARLRRWLMVAGTLDVRVGGEVHLVVAPGAHAVGTVTIVEPGRRFAYTHGWIDDTEMPPGSTSVEVLLEPEHDGTRVTIHHHGLPDGYADMADGWADFLQRLARTARGEHNRHDWRPDMETATTGAVLESALFALLSAFRAVKTEQRPAATGSTEFTIEEVAQHLVDNARWLAPAIGASLDTAASHQAAHLEVEVADALWPIVRTLEAHPPGHQLDLGQPIGSETVTKYLSVEFLVHAWDVTHALGHPLDASTALVDTVHRHCRETRTTLFFQPGSYDEALPAPPNATSLESLLALTGRSGSASTVIRQ